jgi:hypothetical protein
MEIISTSNPSLANPPVSFAIHIDAMVPDVNKKAIRNGRGAAAWVLLAAANASVKTKSVDRIRRGEVILLFVKRNLWN